MIVFFFTRFSQERIEYLLSLTFSPSKYYLCTNRCGIIITVTDNHNLIDSVYFAASTLWMQLLLIATNKNKQSNAWYFFNISTKSSHANVNFLLGIMGGEGYNHPGGGANYLCLPHNPKYDKYKDGHQDAGYVYGTEYEVSQYSGDPFKRSIHNHDAPCVVCFAKSRGSMLMMPARNDCPSGWTEEYHDHKHSRNFVCVDGDPEYVPGTHANKDGALLYAVEGVCGSLPCLPYVSGRELTCAVCTK